MDGLKTKQTSNALQSVVWNCMVRTLSLTAEEANAVRTGVGPAENAPPGSELAKDDVFSELRSPRILLQGWAAEQQVLGDGRRQIFRFVLPGDVFGLQMTPHASMANVTAVSAVTHAPLRLSSPLAEEGGPTPVFAKIADILLAEFIRELQNQVVRLGQLSAYERVAHLMLELYFRLDRVGLTKGLTFEMPLSQEILADALGLSAVHTNRVLQKLRSDGLLEIQRNTYCLMDLRKLALIADYGALRRPI